MTRLPFSTSAFDAICAFHSIIHVPAADHPTVIEEFERVLRPGGLLSFSTGSEAWEGTNSDWLASGVEMRWSFPGLSATREFLDDAGFGIECERVVADELAENDNATFLFVFARLTR